MSDNLMNTSYNPHHQSIVPHQSLVALAEAAVLACDRSSQSLAINCYTSSITTLAIAADKVLYPI